MSRVSRVCCLCLLVASIALSAESRAAQPYFATGIRIGEVTADTAIVWVRLTETPERVPFGGPMPTVRYQNERGEFVDRAKDRDPALTPMVYFPLLSDGSRIAKVQDLEGAATGCPGEVRLRYRAKGQEEWSKTDWARVLPEADFTRQIRLEGLQPNARYDLEVESRLSQALPGESLAGAFRTAPLPDAEEAITFVVSTCQRYPHRDSAEGFKIYGHILAQDPHFFVHAGDILYYDELGKSLELARWHWQRMYSMPSNREFHRRVSSYFMKDDHDTWVNDCWPAMESKYMGEFTFEEGRKTFLEQVPMGEKTYRTVRWGRDLQIWMVEGRDYRSPNTQEDASGKTIWGAEQMAWFKQTVSESDATFRVLISPTPVVGPDRASKNDNHANAGFAHEGGELRRFLAEQRNMLVICGDRHWQYVSRDADTGLLEFSCGPASNEHASGWREEDRRPEHEYLNVIGGFLAVSVQREDGVPQLIGRHYSVDGEILNERRIASAR